MKLDITDSYRAFHPKIEEYTFSLSVLGTFLIIDHILGHKKGHNIFKKKEISTIFLDHTKGSLDESERE